jgi:beta-glucanase (GH16 family)
MNKGTLNQLFQSPKTYRIQKLVTLVTASCVFLALVSIDASAATASQAGAVGTAVVDYHAVSLAAAATEQSVGTVGELHSLTVSSHAGVSSPKTNSSKKKSTKSQVDRSNGISSKNRGKSKVTTTISTPTTSTTQRPTAPITTNSPSSGTSTNPPAQTTTTTAKPAPTTTTTTATLTTTTTSGPTPNTSYPIGTPDSSDQTGYAPPSATALSGYHQTYVTTFTGTSLPPDWQLYEGVPQGDASGQFDRAHVTVSGGLLRINTYQDPNFNNEWVTGGTSLSGIAGQTYGAYFVRSRLTGPGPTGVELLWPDAPVWPPEIDFNETYGSTTATSATVHYTSANSQIPKSLNIDMTQWHTFGVIWTANSITYTVDGNVWGTVTQQSAIPNIPMHISLQSQTWCSSGWACPTAPQSMLVDWVAEYTAN